MGLKKLHRKLVESENKIWFFPIGLTVVLVLLTCLNINGSSIGIYSELLKGDISSSTLAGKPRSIRSDEWAVTTQMTLAQYSNGFHNKNKNIGHGADMSIAVDAPYLDWSELFKIHNWAFFILPFSFAFAFKWWFMGYLLIVSVYFFCLLFLPKKYLLASLLGVAFFFSPFVQWWYQYITLAPIYYTLFAGCFFVLLTRSKEKKHKYLYTLLLTYTLISLALVEYPAFQIPCILVMLSFMIGYIINIKRNGYNKHIIKNSIAYGVIACVLACGITGLYIYNHLDTVRTITSTVYPGDRDISSGGFSFTHLLGSHLGGVFQSGRHAMHYNMSNIGLSNQSESSNFMLVLPWLFVPLIWLLCIKYRKEKQLDWAIVSTLVIFAIYMAWMYVPNIDLLGKILFLNNVPHQRLLIGVGMLNLFSIVLFMKNYKYYHFPKNFIYTYTAIVTVCIFAVSLYVHDIFPLFVGSELAIALSIPIPVVVFLLLNHKYRLAVGLFCLFSIVSSFAVNPLQSGLKPLIDNPVSTAIKSKTGSGGWAIQDSIFENFALMNNKKSFSGVYVYPQLDLWKNIGNHTDIYNRYAHVNFVFKSDTPTKLVLQSTDHFSVVTEPCSDFIKQNNIKYILTGEDFNKKHFGCIDSRETINTKSGEFKIYSLDY